MNIQRKEVLAKRLNSINKEIALLGQYCKLVAVTKHTSIEDIQILYELGVRDFGENRVDQLFERSKIFSRDDICWHFIGHLQSNKVSKLSKVKNLKYIHSIDSLKILKKLRDSTIDQSIKKFIQVNTSGEDQKYGFNLRELEKIKEALLFDNVIGLMTMSKLRTELFEKDAEECFLKLKTLKDYFEEYIKENFEKDLKKNDNEINDLKLSMGMSNDFKIALINHSNFIRIGSLLFK